MAGTIRNPVTSFVVAVLGMAWGLTAVAQHLSGTVAAWLAVTLVAGMLGTVGFVAWLTKSTPEKLVQEHDPVDQAERLFPVSAVVEDMVLEILDRHDALRPRLGEAEGDEETVDAG